MRTRRRLQRGEDGRVSSALVLIALVCLVVGAVLWGLPDLWTARPSRDSSEDAARSSRDGDHGRAMGNGGPSPGVEPRPAPSSAEAMIGSLLQKKAGTQTAEERRMTLQVLFTLLEREGRLREYVETLERSLTGGREDRDTLEDLVLLLGSPSVRDPERQLRHLKGLLEFDRTDPGMLMLAAKLAAEHRNAASAFDLTVEAAALQPDRAVSMLLIGARTLRGAGDVERSDRLCRLIVDNPRVKPQQLLHAARIQEDLGKPEAALETYRLAKARNDVHTLDFARLGICRIRTRQQAVDEVRPELTRLAADSLSPSIRREAAELLGQSINEDASPEDER